MPMSPRLLRPIAARATSIDPASVPGLFSWWDAADATTVTLDSGRVSGLADKSGANRNLTNTTSGSTQPDYITSGINGRNVVRFAAASSQRLSVAGSFGTFNFVHNGDDAFIAGVFAPGAIANPNVLHTLFGNALPLSNALIGVSCNYDDRSFTNNSFNINISNGTANVSQVISANSMPSQVASVFRLAIDADNATAASRIVARINGIAPNSSGTGTPTGSNAVRNFFVGCDGNVAQFLSGDFCELMFYNQHPTQAHQDALFSYLATKWGVAV